MTQRDLLLLIEKFLAGTADEAEKDRLEQYFNSHGLSGVWSEDELGDRAETEQRILERLQTAIHHAPPVAVPLYRRKGWMIAATVVFLFSCTWLFLIKEKTKLTSRNALPVKDKPMVVKRTTLTLADGSVVVLDSQPEGTLAAVRNSRIRKHGNSIKVNAARKKDSVAYAGYLTLKTPRGKQFKAVLEDGSQVWLNTASSLRFPAAFGSSERRVEVSGEAYFEVVNDPARPFRVLALAPVGSNHRGTLVEVMGTHFNVNAYTDEEMTKTTVLEGRVKVGVAGAATLEKAAAVLRPGEQAQVSLRKPATDVVTVKHTDGAEVVAWTNNVFYFNNEGLQSIMRQLARWYDVEVVYASKVPPRNFSGKISRDAPLSMVLEILEQSNIRLTVKGNQIIVRS